MPSPSAPTSSTSSAASPRVVTSVQSSWKWALIGSTPTGTPSRRPSSATSLKPSTTWLRAASSPSAPAGPVRQTNALGPKAASRRMPALIASTRSSAVSGPGRQRQDRGHGGDAGGRPEPALAERRELLLLAALDELELADSDSSGARSRVGGEVLLEARLERRDLDDRERGGTWR